MRSCFIKSSEAEIRYFEFEGSGHPLLFIHGLGCAASFEYPHIAASMALSRNHILLLDLFGFGFSNRPDKFGYNIIDHANTIVEFINLKSFETVNLFGHSMGGAIAIRAATLLGDRVQNLILSEPNLDFGGGQFSRQIASISENEYIATGHEAAICNANSTGSRAWAATMRASDAKAVYYAAKSLVKGDIPSWREQLYDHPANKSVIFGASSLPDADYEELPNHGIKTMFVERAGHSMAVQNPEGLANSIKNSMK